MNSTTAKKGDTHTQAGSIAELQGVIYQARPSLFIGPCVLLADFLIFFDQLLRQLSSSVHTNRETKNLVLDMVDASGTKIQAPSQAHWAK